MKIRQGFVSNSSSSSFVVTFPKDFEISTDNVHELLFGTSEQHQVLYYDYSSDSLTIARVVADDMEAQLNLPDDKHLREAFDGWVEGGPEYDDFRIPEEGVEKWRWPYDWNAYSQAREKFLDIEFAKFKAEQDPDSKLFIFSYSDNDGELGCVMEHGGIFDKLPHKQISQH